MLDLQEILISVFNLTDFKLEILAGNKFCGCFISANLNQILCSLVQSLVQSFVFVVTEFNKHFGHVLQLLLHLLETFVDLGLVDVFIYLDIVHDVVQGSLFGFYIF